jgi:hypothetical protein
MPVSKRLSGPRAEEVRYRIKVVQIINRMQDYFFQDGEGGPIKISQRQFYAAKILLNKALPDLSSIKMETTGDSQVVVYQQTFDAQGKPVDADRIRERVAAFNEGGEDDEAGEGTD